jgi:hypothetical protein
MAAFLSSIMATFVTLPMIAFLIFYVFARILMKNGKKAFLLTVDLSTFFFILSVYYLILVIWEKSFMSYIFMILIIICMIFLLLHWKFKQEIDIRKVMKGFWRFNFLFFSFCYICLVIFGLFKRLSESQIL